MVAGGTDPQPVDHLTGWLRQRMKRNEERSLALKIVIVGNGKVGFPWRNSWSGKNMTLSSWICGRTPSAGPPTPWIL